MTASKLVSLPSYQAQSIHQRPFLLQLIEEPFDLLHFGLQEFLHLLIFLNLSTWNIALLVNYFAIV